MKLQRFFGKFDFRNKEVESSDYELINQIKNVFRYQRGAEVLLLDGLGKEALGEIRKIDSDIVVFEIKKVTENENITKNKVALYCSILKKENFELVTQKATEIGVSEIYPLLSARTLKQNIKEDRMLKIIKEASEQSERGTIPVLHSPVEFRYAIKNTNKNDLNLFFDHSGQNISEIKNTENKKINIFIGPEGGWEEYERESAKENNFKIVSLGKLNLRGETAAIVASYLACGL
ncbi:MAG: RsmE family RNA methyltransferase [bacterium]